jgi:hypothetical protein
MNGGCNTCGSELVKVWSALTLLGSYNGCLCAFRVEQVNIFVGVKVVHKNCKSEQSFFCRRQHLSYHWQSPAELTNFTIMTLKIRIFHHF